MHVDEDEADKGVDSSAREELAKPPAGLDRPLQHVDETFLKNAGQFQNLEAPGGGATEGAAILEEHPTEPGRPEYASNGSYGVRMKELLAFWNRPQDGAAKLAERPRMNQGLIHDRAFGLEELIQMRHARFWGRQLPQRPRPAKFDSI